MGLADLADSTDSVDLTDSAESRDSADSADLTDLTDSDFKPHLGSLGINNNNFFVKAQTEQSFLTKDTDKDTHSIDGTDLQTLKKDRLNFPRNLVTLT